MRLMTVILLLCALIGCASRPAPTLYDELGNKPGLDRLLDALEVEVKTNVRINHLFEQTDWDYLHARLFDQICELAGGPCVYDGLSMTEAHTGMEITRAEFNWFVEDLQRAMAKVELPQATQNRLLALLAPMHGEVIGQ